MSKEDEEKELEAKRAQENGGKTNKKTNNLNKPDENKGAASLGRQAEGININFFKKNCGFLAGCRDEIVERILVA